LQKWRGMPHGAFALFLDGTLLCPLVLVDMRIKEQNKDHPILFLHTCTQV